MCRLKLKQLSVYQVLPTSPGRRSKGCHVREPAMAACSLSLRPGGVPHTPRTQSRGKWSNLLRSVFSFSLIRQILLTLAAFAKSPDIATSMIHTLESVQVWYFDKHISLFFSFSLEFVLGVEHCVECGCGSGRSFGAASGKRRQHSGILYSKAHMTVTWQSGVHTEYDGGSHKTKQLTM